MAMASRTKRKQAREEFLNPDRPENFEQRNFGVLVLDGSASMAGDIDEENAALARFVGNLKENPVTAKRIRLAIVIVSGDRPTIVPFADAEHFEPPTLCADGATPLAQGIISAYELISNEKAKLTEGGIDFNKAVVIALGDFGATDRPEVINEACSLVHQGEAAEHPQDAVAFFPFATEFANEQLLQRIARRSIRRMKDCKFDDFFRWVAMSLNTMSLSQPGQRIRLSEPVDEGWATM